MTNHIHLVAIPDTLEGFARGIGHAHRRYTWMINQRFDKRGYLFQGRFYSEPLDEGHFWYTMRYTEQNAVEAGIVTNPWEYKWSSARFNLGMTSYDPLIKKREVEPRRWMNFLKGT